MKKALLIVVFLIFDFLAPLSSVSALCRSNTRQVSGLALNPDGKSFVVSYKNGRIDYWKLNATEPQHPYEFARYHSNLISTVAYSPNGQYIITTSWDGTAKLWDTQSGVLIRTFNAINGVSSAAFSPDSKTVLIADAGISPFLPSSNGHYSVDLWDVSSGQLLKNFEAAVGFKVAYAPNGKTILIGGQQVARLLDVQSGKILFNLDSEIEDKFSVISVAAYSLDSKLILFGGYGFVQLWDAQSGRRFQTLFQGQATATTSAAFAPDGKTAVTASWDGKVKVWDVQSGRLIHTLAWLTVNGETYAAYLPDGKTVLTSSWDGLIQLWNAPSRTLVRSFCAP